jgi:HAT1-interacting factor 1
MAAESPHPTTDTLEGLPAKLDHLKAAATKEYSLKNYDAAAELYSEAAAVQDSINGEMSVDNADLLYQYGRCLYHVAVANSDVLGGKVAATSSEPKRKKRKVAKEDDGGNGEGSSHLISDAIKSGEEKMAEDVVEAAVEQKDGMRESKPAEGSSNPFFTIMGDENFTDSEDDADEDEGAEEEEDDFATAYEILDMARVLLTRKLASTQDDTDKSTMERAEVRAVKERLADTHDLQAEIALENENFTAAVNDSRDGLALKLQLYPNESSLIAEAHFKLSLALEFASVTSTQESADGEKKVAEVDEAMRAEAATEMELAIASTKARLMKEEAAVSTLDASKAAEKKKEIDDVTEMIGDMEQRLDDLRKPATSLSALQNLGPAGAPGDDEAAMRGILGSLLGETKADQTKRLQEATAQANDLTGMVKKKKAKTQEAPVMEGKGKGKRKADDDGADEGAGAAMRTTAANGSGKKVKFSEDQPEILDGGDGGDVA